MAECDARVFPSVEQQSALIHDLKVTTNAPGNRFDALRVLYNLVSNVMTKHLDESRCEHQEVSPLWMWLVMG